MKKNLFMALLVFSTISHASFLGGLITGAALSSKKTVIKSETDQQKLINILNNTIPMAKDGSRNSYLNFNNENKPSDDDDAWRSFKYPMRSFPIEGYNETMLLTYYKNLGYNVSISNHYLVFNFSKQYEMYKIHIKTISRLSKFSFGMLTIFLLLIIWRIIQSYLYKQKIFKYMANSVDIHFWDTTDKASWINAVDKNRLPPHWSFKINDETKKVIGISYYNGNSFGRIASTGNPLPNWLSAEVMKELK